MLLLMLFMLLEVTTDVLNEQVYFIGKDDQLKVVKQSLRSKLKAMFLSPNNIMEYLLFLQEYNPAWSRIRAECKFGKLDPSQQDMLVNLTARLKVIQDEIIDEVIITEETNLDMCRYLERKSVSNVAIVSNNTTNTNGAPLIRPSSTTAVGDDSRCTSAVGGNIAAPSNVRDSVLCEDVNESDDDSSDDEEIVLPQVLIQSKDKIRNFRGEVSTQAKQLMRIVNACVDLGVLDNAEPNTLKCDQTEVPANSTEGRKTARKKKVGGASKFADKEERNKKVMRNEFTEMDKIMYGAFSHLFLFGEGVLGKGPMKDDLRAHCLGFHDRRFATDSKFDFYVGNQMQH